MKKSDGASSVVRKVANALRLKCLEHEEGELIGSEEDLFVRYNVSRPTFRQAAGLLAQEQLLVIKRGVGGGYFASRPKPDAVAHITAIYLQSRHTDVDEIFHAVTPLRVELSRLAARCTDEEAREELAQFYAAERVYESPHLAKGRFDPAEYKEFLKSERKFARILGRMAGNKVLHLFLEMLYEFFAMILKEEDIYRHDPSRAITYRGLRMRIVEAILGKDEQLAILHAERCGAALNEWLADDKTARLKRRTDNLLLLTDEKDRPAPARRPRSARASGAS